MVGNGKIVVLAVVITMVLCAAGIAPAAQTEQIHFTGTVFFPAGTNPKAPCGTSTYDSYCASGHCGCVKYTSSKVVGNIVGSLPTAGAAEIDFTFDIGAELPNAIGGCVPFFATASIPGPKDNEQINFAGVQCDGIKRGQSLFQGGYGIASSSTSYSGWGTINGAYDQNNGVLKLVFRGPIFSP